MALIPQDSLMKDKFLAFPISKEEKNIPFYAFSTFWFSPSVLSLIFHWLVVESPKFIPGIKNILPHAVCILNCKMSHMNKQG